MKQRRFPLESIVDLRTAAKRKAEDNLALAIRDRAKAEQLCIIAKADFAALAEQLLGKSFTADTQSNGLRALTFQGQTCRMLETKLAEADLKITEVRGLLVTAVQEFEAVQKLRSKWAAKQAKEVAKAEEVALDDFVNARFVARNLEDSKC